MPGTKLMLNHSFNFDHWLKNRLGEPESEPAGHTSGGFYGSGGVFQSLSCVWLFATLWTAARQASLSLAISRSLPKFMSIMMMRQTQI